MSRSNHYAAPPEYRGDGFFSNEQIARLTELMARWRAARDTGVSFPADDQDELDRLIEAELMAAIARSAALLAKRSVATSV